MFSRWPACVGAALSGHLGDPFPFSPWFLVVPALATRLFTGLVVGVIWAVWHLPAFAIGATAHSAWDFGPYFLGVVALSVIVTALYNVSRGSLLIAALVHVQMMNPILPEAQPWENVVVVLVAIVIVLRNPAMMLRGEGAVTDVLMGERDADPRRGVEGSGETRRA